MIIFIDGHLREKYFKIHTALIHSALVGQLKNENNKEMIVQMECWSDKNTWRWGENEVWEILVW